jgi:polygalacturonase
MPALRLDLLSILLVYHISATRLSFNGVPDDKASAVNNTAKLNSVFASLLPGDTLAFANETFWLAGGVHATGLVNVTLRLDGTLKFLAGRKGWPTEPCRPPHDNKTCVQKAIHISDATGLTLTSTDGGTVDGSGESWWGYAQYLIHREDRPKLLTIQNSTDILVEHWHFLQSAYHTFHADDVARLEIRYCTIENRVNNDDGHGALNLDALNTDGFDVSGRDIYIHDSSVWNQDDCFTIVPIDGRGTNAQCTENILIEDVNASGLGLTIGSIEPTEHHACIRNVTFRRAMMHHTVKGIYMKSGNRAHPDPNATAEITNILYEDIVMEAPEQVPIWIGPAQEGDSENACSLTWPENPLSKCPPPLKTVAWTNVTLRNVSIRGAKVSPGVIFGNPEKPMQGILFDKVVFDPVDPSARPWAGSFYYCKGVNGFATNGTIPAPPCFH